MNLSPVLLEHFSQNYQDFLKLTKHLSKQRLMTGVVKYGCTSTNSSIAT